MVHFTDIPYLRLESQHIGGKQHTSPKDIVARMAAMQAQDFPLAKWAIGVRLRGSTEKAVDHAMDRGEILRTHLLRPTWHFVTAGDIYWLLELTAPQIIASQRGRDKQLELTPQVYSRSNAIIEKALQVHGQLARAELLLELENAGIATYQNRSSHLLMRAELDGLICSGTLQRGKPTYALLAERVPIARRLSKEEALAELAERYFSSRYPATLQDFTWWSGLPAGEARHALDAVKSHLVQEQIAGKTYWLPQNSTDSNIRENTTFFLPNYDEFIISYTDRSASLRPEHVQYMNKISNRGMFWPIIVLNGQVIGTWKRSIKKGNLILEIQPFIKLGDKDLVLIEQAAAQYAQFVDHPVSILKPSQAQEIPIDRK